jgi:hypothetical protein
MKLAGVDSGNPAAAGALLYKGPGDRDKTIGGGLEGLFGSGGPLAGLAKLIPGGIDQLMKLFGNPDSSGGNNWMDLFANSEGGDNWMDLFSNSGGQNWADLFSNSDPLYG